MLFVRDEVATAGLDVLTHECVDTSGIKVARLGTSIKSALAVVVPGTIRSCTRLASASPNNFKPRLRSCRKSFRDFGRLTMSFSKLSVDTVELSVDAVSSHCSIDSSSDWRLSSVRAFGCAPPREKSMNERHRNETNERRHRAMIANLNERKRL